MTWAYHIIFLDSCQHGFQVDLVHVKELKIHGVELTSGASSLLCAGILMKHIFLT